MKLPELFEIRTRALLGEEYDSFLSSHHTDVPTSIRLNTKKISVILEKEKVQWCDSGFYLDKRPLFTLDPLFHSGCYYVQEAGSMFLEQVLKQYLKEENPVILDLCAAPGGKSSHIASLLNGKGLLVSNEVIRSRAKILAENLTKWGAPNVMITNNDPKDFSRLEGLFDVIVVDAPCSGEGMFRKDPASIEEWSPDNVRLCCERQRRILADIFPSLKEGGILIYSTCTYNKEEDENNIKWIQDELGTEYLPLQIEKEWNIVDSGMGYHFFPHRTKGEGFFLAVLRKTEEGNSLKIKGIKDKEIRKEHIPEDMKRWIVDTGFKYKLDQDEVSVIPSAFSSLLFLLEKELRIIQSGILIGRLKGKDILPDISLAFSWILDKEAFNVVEVEWEQAIAYLRRESLYLCDVPKGWVLLQFCGQTLGWVKNLGNRVNNIYPQEWKIKMESDISRYTPILNKSDFKKVE